MSTLQDDAHSLAAQLERLGRMRKSEAILESEFTLFKSKVIESATAASADSVVDQLERLDKLYRENLLSDSEFFASKQKVNPTSPEVRSYNRFSKPQFGYVPKTLIPGENVIAATNISLIAHLWKFLLGALLFIIKLPISGGFDVALMLIAVLLIVHPIIMWFTNHLVLTDRRLIVKMGIIAIDVIEMKLDKIESVNVRQGIIGRLLNYGRIAVTGSGGSRQSFPSVNSPTRFKLEIDKVTDSFKR